MKIEGSADIRRWSTNRVEAFSDAVFAIAITLLVLEIRLEPGAYQHLGRALLDEWPSYLAYVTSFLTVGAVWLAMLWKPRHRTHRQPHDCRALGCPWLDERPH